MWWMLLFICIFMLIMCMVLMMCVRLFIIFVNGFRFGWMGIC